MPGITNNMPKGEYRVYARYAGGPAEVIETGVDYAEAQASADEMWAKPGWSAWLERED